MYICHFNCATIIFTEQTIPETILLLENIKLYIIVNDIFLVFYLHIAYY